MSRPELIIIGASWGGLHAVGELLAELPADFPVPVLVVLHRGEDSRDGLANLLNRRGALPVVEAEDKAELAPGCVRVAPPGYHAFVEPGHVALSTEEQHRFSRPSIDLTFETAAEAYGAGLVGVVLTGNNEDGARGLAEIRRRGGIAIVQDPETAERPTMPRAAQEAAQPQHVSDLAGIAERLKELVA
jgi:two-component system chemotaxis response regulator CheB